MKPRRVRTPSEDIASIRKKLQRLRFEIAICLRSIDVACLNAGVKPYVAANQDQFELFKEPKK